ncbi:hypothetical protein SprV_0502004400 [Sparganum proliferum]
MTGGSEEGNFRLPFARILPILDVVSSSRPQAVCRRSRQNPLYSPSTSSLVVPPFPIPRLGSKRTVADRVWVPLVWPLSRE